MDRAAAAARKAFGGWSRTTPAERSAALLRIADRIEAEAGAFAALEALNCGKPINAALNDELPAVVDCFRYFAGAVRCMTGALAGEYLPGHTSMIRRDPVGVIASIAPWNYPLMMMAWKLCPAIGGGNTVVFKPSEQTPLTALKLARILAEELPEGVVSVIAGRGQTVGSYLINHPQVDMISLTGDVATGRKMLDAAAKTVIVCVGSGEVEEHPAKAVTKAAAADVKASAPVLFTTQHLSAPGHEVEPVVCGSDSQPPSSCRYRAPRRTGRPPGASRTWSGSPSWPTNSATTTSPAGNTSWSRSAPGRGAA